jgi:hypothetical protein
MKKEQIEIVEKMAIDFAQKWTNDEKILGSMRIGFRHGAEWAFEQDKELIQALEEYIEFTNPLVATSVSTTLLFDPTNKGINKIQELRDKIKQLKDEKKD